jgi:HSP20 family molecular chaperone IbpA
MTTQAATKTDAGARRAARPEYVPAVDLYETLDDYVIEACVPGVAEGDLSVKVDNRVLSLEATSRYEAPKGAQTVYRGVVGGVYKRSFRLPDDIEVGQIGAALNQGVLTVRLPKRHDAKPRKIEVNVSG